MSESLLSQNVTPSVGFYQAFRPPACLSRIAFHTWDTLVCRYASRRPKVTSALPSVAGTRNLNASCVYRDLPVSGQRLAVVVGANEVTTV